MHLNGRVAIVTGAGRGIGREVALLLARQGATVVVNDPGVGRGGETTEERPADELVNEILKAGGRAKANYDSVADYQKTGVLVQNTVDEFGKLDILVNVAGVLRERMIWNMTEEDFDLVIAVHLKGHWNMCHHAIKHMRKENYGRIVNFASDAFKGSVGQCNYSAAKGGIVSLTRAIARETSRYDITSNALCPSADTRMTVNEAVKANRRRKLEAGLMTQAHYDRTTRDRGPEYIAPIVGFLCTDEARDVTGQNFHVERGMLHTYYYGEEQRALHKASDDGMFTVDELMELIPNSLLAGLPAIAPKQMQQAEAAQ
ncbi:SDR family oxidoreductase [Corticibacterium sp. UT-5YL-CI-8]|nr:SDR family oxidoreductase [Tianweitania sp. UT-5YL-CI-8]